MHAITHTLQASGLGPKTLELDRSHSGRLHAPSLRHFGLKCAQLHKQEALPPAQECAYMLKVCVQEGHWGGQCLAAAFGWAGSCRGWDKAVLGACGWAVVARTQPSTCSQKLCG